MQAQSSLYKFGAILIIILLCSCQFSDKSAGPLPEQVDPAHKAAACINLAGQYWSGRSSENIKIQSTKTSSGLNLFINSLLVVDGKKHSISYANETSYRGLCLDGSLKIETFKGDTVIRTVSYAARDSDVIITEDRSLDGSIQNRWIRSPQHNGSECPNIIGHYKNMVSGEEINVSLYEDNDFTKGLHIEEGTDFYSLRIKGEAFELEFGKAYFQSYSAGCSEGKVIVDYFSKEKGLEKKILYLYDGYLVQEQYSATVKSSKVFEKVLKKN